MPRTNPDRAAKLSKFTSVLFAKHQPWFNELYQATAVARHRALWLSLFTNGLAMVTPIYVLQVYDKVIFHQNLDTLNALVIGMLGVIIFEFILRYIRSGLLRGISIQCDSSFSSKLFNHLFNLPLRIIESKTSASWHHSFIDLERIRNRLSGPTAAALMDFPFAFVMLLLLYLIAKPVFLVPVIFSAIIIAVIWRADHVIQRRVAAEQSSLTSRAGKLTDLLSARDTIKAMQMQDAAFVRWSEAQAELIKNSYARGNSSDGFENLGQSIAMLTTVITVAIGSIAIINGQMTLGALIAANMLTARAIGSMVRMISLWRTFRESIEAENRLSEIFAYQTEAEASLMPLKLTDGIITIDSVSFKYRENAEFVLQDLAGNIHGGGIYAMIGDNGSGKSTLLKIIRGLYQPLRGRILIDQQDIRQFSNQELSNAIGYLPQNPEIINASIYDNLTFGISHPVKAGTVRQACEDAGCADYIATLADGYNSQLSTDAVRLSPGIIQKLALARIYVREPKILLLDEPSNHLDMKSLLHLISHLEKLAKTKTILLVTHHVRLLASCKIVAQLDNGKIKRIGEPKMILPSLT